MSVLGVARDYIHESRRSLALMARLKSRGRHALAQFLEGKSTVPYDQNSEELNERRRFALTTLRCLQAADALGLERPTALSLTELGQVVAKAGLDREDGGGGNYFGKRNFLTSAVLVQIFNRYMDSERTRATAAQHRGADSSDGEEGASAKAVEAVEAAEGVVRSEWDAQFSRQKELEPYLLLWASTSQCPKRVPDETESEILKRFLFDQLALHSMQYWMRFDVVQTTAACLLLAGGTQLEPALEKAVRRGAELALTRSSMPDSVRSPRPVFFESDRPFYGAPHEEVFLATQLPLKLLPKRMGHVHDVVTRLEAEFIEDPRNGEGWTAISGQSYPAPMTWATAFNTLLLAQAERALRYAYTETVLDDARETDERRVVRFEDGYIDPPNVGSWDDDVVETTEGAKRAIESAVFPQDGDQPSRPQKRSLLLFGPPGTSKTTLVRGVAWSLRRETMADPDQEEKWPLLIVNPSDLLARTGYEGLANGLRELLQVVRELSEVVVFFDEAENYVFERNEKGETRQDRLVTAAMLPLLSGISSKDIVFVMATNDIEAIDSAIKRRGRFDVRIAVGPPDENARVRLLARASGRDAATIRSLLRADDTNGLTIPEIVEIGRSLEGDDWSRERADAVLARYKTRRAIPDSVLTKHKNNVASYHDG